MKACSPELAAFLAAATEYVYTDVFSFELRGGTDANYRLYLTKGQQDLTVAPVDGSPDLVTYRADVAIIEGLRFKAGIGLEVDEQDVVITPLAGALVQGLTFQVAARRRIFDGAVVRRDRFYFERFGQPPIGGLPMFYGLISTSRQSGGNVTLKVKSAKILLDEQMPRHLQQPTCVYTVFDQGCGLAQADFSVNGVVGADPTPSVIPWADADPAYSMGTIFFENMGDVGESRTIREGTATDLNLAYPLPQAPAAADQFVACPGCDGSAAACDRFANAARRLSFDFVPKPETAF